jgi:hypothetical protein
MEIDIEKMRKRLSKIKHGDPIKNKKIERVDTLLEYLDSNYELVKVYEKSIKEIETKINKLGELAEQRVDEVFVICRDFEDSAVDIKP